MSFVKKYIHQFIDWELISNRLNSYDTIGKLWTINDLQKYNDSSPYYCHYMAWVLGTWENEKQIEFMNEILRVSSNLEHWEYEKSLLMSKDYHTLYSLMWQIQIAYWLNRKDEVRKLRWNIGGGPDLIFELNDNELYLECYVKNKSYTDEIFITEIVKRIDKRIHVKHQIFMKHKIESKLDFEIILKKINDEFKPNSYKYINTNPVIIYQSIESNLIIYFNNEKIEQYDPSVLPLGGGLPEIYAKQMICESIKDKNERNKLKDHRPNILAINFLVSSDLQLSKNFILDIDKGVGSNIDNIMLFTCGINEIPSDNYVRLKGNIIV